MKRFSLIVVALGLAALSIASCGLKDSPEPAPPLFGDKTRQPTQPAERRGVDLPDNPLDAEDPAATGQPF